MINRAVLVGRLTRDTELRYTTSGTAVGTFSLAVNRQFTNQAGEREADFINCVIWRKGAENFANFTHKGSLVGVEGRIQTRNYENQQGQRVYVTELVVESFSLLEPRDKNGTAPLPPEPNSPAETSNTAQTKASSNIPASREHPNFASNEPFGNNGQSIDINDDDLPF